MFKPHYSVHCQSLQHEIRPSINVEAIFGGHLLGVRGPDSIVFYDWETDSVVRHIQDARPKVCGAPLSSLHCFQY